MNFEVRRVNLRGGRDVITEQMLWVLRIGADFFGHVNFANWKA